MRRLIVIFTFLACALAFGSAEAADKYITMKGSTTVLPIAQRTAEVFMKDRPDVSMSVQGGGSGIGAAGIIDGTCDIGNMSRSMKEAELAQAGANGRNAKANVIAMDGIAVIVHPSNKISALTKKQVKDIYTGKVSNWSQIGGDSGKIVVISRDSASGTFEAFGTLALAGDRVRPDALLEASNQAVATTVAKTPGAIGYVGLGFITNEVKAVTVDGIEVSKKTVLMNQYPYTRPLFMYTNGAPKGVVKEYIDFVLSKEGQKLAEEEGYVGLQ